MLAGPAEADSDVYCMSSGEAGRSGSEGSPERDSIYECNPGKLYCKLYGSFIVNLIIMM